MTRSPVGEAMTIPRSMTLLKSSKSARGRKGRCVQRALSGIVFLTAVISTVSAATLENAHVAICIDAEHGGAITKMLHKQAPGIPFIAERGAGVAGQGRLLVPTVSFGTHRFNLTGVVM